MMCDIFDV